jgi:hypothetical protein
MFRKIMATTSLVRFIALATLFLIANQYGCKRCVDFDGDGYGNPSGITCKHFELDCDDGNPDVNPSKTEGPYKDETCYDGLDNDCNGLADSEDPNCISKGLTRQDFKKIGSGGFGDRANSYAWSMELFNGDLYVGTNRHHNWQVMQAFAQFGLDVSALVPGPVDGTWGHLAWAEETRGGIWRYRPNSAQPEWEIVHQAEVLEGVLPIMPNSSLPTPPTIVGYYPESYGYRTLGSFNGHLYAIGIGMWVPNMPFSSILRSADGENWENVTGIISDATNPRGLAVYHDKLFVSASIAGSSPGGAGYSMVYASDDPKTEDWTEVSLPGFGNENNVELPYLTVFDDHLYASTINYKTGFEVWKTDGTLDPEDPKGERYVWTQVIKDGYGDTWNQWGMTMKGFGEYLYVGSSAGIGIVLKNGIPVGSRPFDVIRVDKNDNAELVVGAYIPRDPPPGWPKSRTPLSGWPAGFGNALNVYVWMMEEHNGWLYLGSLDMGNMVITDFWDLLIKPIAGPISEQIFNQIFKKESPGGGADLWKTKDGIHWEPVFINGFGNRSNVGIRRMLSVGDLLYVTTANGNTGDPEGGCEVWVGQE